MYAKILVCKPCVAYNNQTKYQYLGFLIFFHEIMRHVYLIVCIHRFKKINYVKEATDFAGFFWKKLRKVHISHSVQPCAMKILN